MSEIKTREKAEESYTTEETSGVGMDFQIV